MKDLKLKLTAKPKDIVIFVLFCLFLLYLVAIGVLNLYELSHFNKLKGLNPFPAFGPEFLTTTLTLYLLALLAAFMSTSNYFFDREKGFGFGKKKDKDDPGWSRWMKEDEMKEAYNIKRIKLTDETYEHAGIPIILNNKEAYVDDGENHSLIIGASGSGKTWTIIDPLVKILGKGGESMVITDPKGEIYEHNANLLRERGYNVVIVNFRDPEHGSAWNPLTLPYRYWKEGKEDKAMELLEDLAVNILVDANNQDPFWQKSAADYFTGLALGLFEDAKSEDEVNLNSINAMSTFGEERIGGSKYDKEYFKLKGELSSAYISASATVLAPAETKGGITSTFRQKIRIFSSRQKLAEMLSYTSFDVRKIGSEKTAMFLKVHDEKTTYHALATIFVKQVYECLIDEAQKCENQKLPIRTNFILDEFANMPALKDVESMITASRSRNMRFNFGIQNFSQLNKVYGKDVAETIKGNCGNMFYLITTEYAALEEISKLLGEVKPKEAKDGKPQPPIRPLVTVSDLQQMKKFEMIIKRWRNQPFKTTHKGSFEIMKNGGWGYTEVISDYPTRSERPIQTFDIKKFVDEHRETNEEGAFPGFGGGNPFIPPFGNPGIGAPISGNQSIPPFGSSSGTSNSPSVDDLVKRIDEQIAKIEAEEKMANNNDASKPNEFEELINKKYEEFKNVNEPALEEPIDEVKEEKIESIDDLFNDLNSNSNITSEPVIEEPKISNEISFEESINPFASVSTSTINNDNALNNEIVDEIPNVSEPNINEFTYPTYGVDINDNISNTNEVKEEEKEVVIPEVVKEEIKPMPYEPIKTNLTVDDLLRKIDEKIAELEKEEQEQNIEVPITKEEANQEFIEAANKINDDIIKEEIEKPLINVDADSIVVDNNITDDEFFDDFFGEDE